MTQGHNLPSPGSFEHYRDHPDDDNQDLSPSDGYFGSNNSIPDTVLLPSSHVVQNQEPSSKMKEAAKESGSSGSNSPSDDRFVSYTPATTNTPTASSQDGGSAYHGATRRYRDSEDEISERSPLLEEPPPLYDDAMAERATSGTINGPETPARCAYETMQVREPVSSFRTSAFSHGQSPQSMTSDTGDDTGKPYDEESDPAVPQQSRRRGCRGRRKSQQKRGSKFRRAISILLGTILAIWLIVYLAQRAHRPRNSPNPTQDPNDHSKAPFSFPPDRRHFHLHETSHSILGTYKLYDLLDLSTTSGSISITVVPQPGSEPAVMRLSSTSGSISVHVDSNYLGNTDLHQASLNRTFETYISGKSGSIRGTILHNGGTTTLSHRSGSLNMDIYPIGHFSGPELRSRINTNSGSGSTTLTIQPPMWGGKITELEASHMATGSGSTTLRYPPQWEGGVHVQSTGSGSLNVFGQGLEYERQSRGDVLAWRGEGKKMIDVSSVGSGSIGFFC